MPAVVDLTLGVRPGLTVYPARLHGAACALLESADADHAAARKPFAVHPLVGNDGGAARWRLGWLGDQLPTARPRVVRFGGTECPVLDYGVQAVRFAELVRTAPVRHAELELISPMYFSRNGRDYPGVEPVLMLRSTVERWNHHASEQFMVGEDLRGELLSTVYLAAMEGHTVKGAISVSMNQTGFVGAVRLALTRDASSVVASLFATLVRFAAIAGFGAQTTHGFGAARLISLGGRTVAGTDHFR